MAEEKKQRMSRAERLEKEREANLLHWEEQDALLFKHRQEAYDIGGPTRWPVSPNRTRGPCAISSGC